MFFRKITTFEDVISQAKVFLMEYELFFTEWPFKLFRDPFDIFTSTTVNTDVKFYLPVY